MSSDTDFKNVAPTTEPGVASQIDFALRRVNISTALDPSYNPKLTLSVLASLYGAAVTFGRFEGHVLGQLIPLVLTTLLVSVPLFLYSGGTIVRRGVSDQGKWAAQCLIGDPILEAFMTVSAYPFKSFVCVSFLAELSKWVGSVYAIAIVATFISAYKYYLASKARRL